MQAKTSYETLFESVYSYYFPINQICNAIMKVLLLILIIISPATILAQKMKLISGSMDGFKHEKIYNIKFKYDSMLVGADIPEKVYLKAKRKQWEIKEEGQGSEFVRLWFEDRKTLYQPAFIKNFEKYAKVKLADENAKYTLIVKTKHTEGGWSAGILNCPAILDGEMWIVDSTNSDNVLAKISFANFNGSKFYGGDFDMMDRIQSAYVLAGKGLGDFLKRKSK
jgi:hypothetical protein